MDTRLQAATLVELLAERRENVLERSAETDRIARGLLAHHIATIDAELARRRQVAAQADALTCRYCGGTCPPRIAFDSRPCEPRQVKS